MTTNMTSSDARSRLGEPTEQVVQSGVAVADVVDEGRGIDVGHV